MESNSCRCVDRRKTTLIGAWGDDLRHEKAAEGHMKEAGLLSLCATQETLEEPSELGRVLFQSRFFCVRAGALGVSSG